MSAASVDEVMPLLRMRTSSLVKLFFFMNSGRKWIIGAVMPLVPMAPSRKRMIFLLLARYQSQAFWSALILVYGMT